MPERTRRVLPVVLRMSGELAVIVLGVLIALSADAWYESLQETDAERRHLTSLHEDLAQTTSQLQGLQRGRDRIEQSLLGLLEADLSDEPVDSVSAWIDTGLFRLVFFEPHVAAMRDLEASGEIGLLPPEVRLGVAELEQQLAVFEGAMDDLRDAQVEHVDPYLVSRLPLAPLLASSDGLAISERLPATPDWSSLETVQARSLMAYKLSLLKVISTYGTGLATEIERLTLLVDARLNELGG